jgi:HlyD family secretion protein
MKLKFLILILVFTIFVLTACNSAATSTAEPTALPPVSADISIVAAGRVMPNQFASIGFSQSGKIAEVLVAEGDTVEADQIIARLESTEAMQAEVARAELEVLLAEQAQSNLYDHSDVDQATLQMAIASAYVTVQDSQNRLDRLAIPDDQAALTSLEAVAQARTALDTARTVYKPYENQKEETETSRELKRKLDHAKMDFNTAVLRAVAEADLANAQAALDEAIADYDADGEAPDADLVTAAAAHVETAKAALAAAQAASEQLVLRAPFAGVITDLDLKAGEFISAGQPSMTVADLTAWIIETEDLTELDVVKLQNGQPASISLDALPNAALNGTVTAIADTYGQRQGDITYRVTLRLANAPADLRWGMTAQVKFTPPAAASTNP